MSKIDYCSSAWANSSFNWYRILQLDLLHLQEVTNRQYKDTVLIYKCMNDLVLSYLCNKFTKRSQIHDHITRNSNDLNITKYCTSAGQRTFRYRATKIWNTLEEPLKCITDLNHVPWVVPWVMFNNFRRKSRSQIPCQQVILTWALRIAHSLFLDFLYMRWCIVLFIH